MNLKRNLEANNNTIAAKTEKQISGLVENLIIHADTSRVLKRGPCFLLVFVNSFGSSSSSSSIIWERKRQKVEGGDGGQSFRLWSGM